MASGKLQSRQKELEDLALVKGAERFIKALEGKVDDSDRRAGVTTRSSQSLGYTKPGRQTISDFVMTVRDRLRKMFQNENGGGKGRSAVNTNMFLYAESFEGVAYLTMKSTIDFFFCNVKRNEEGEAPRTEFINSVGYDVLLELLTHKSRKKPSEEFLSLEKQNLKAQSPRDKKYYTRRINLLTRRMRKVELEADPFLQVRIGVTVHSYFHHGDISA